MKRIIVLLQLIVLCFSTKIALGQRIINDPTFAIGEGANNTIYTVAFQEDDKIILGGEFTSFDQQAYSGIVRLNTDGSIDSQFITGSGFDGTVKKIVLQPDGKILVGGSFISYNSVNHRGIIRLNPDGSLDNSFDPGTGAYDNQYPTRGVEDIIVQPDNKILLGGTFDLYNEQEAESVIRLNTDGSIDPAFSTPDNFGLGGSRVLSMLLQDDGKIIITGWLILNGQPPVRGVIRLNPDGTRDENFNMPVPNDYITCSAFHQDNRILVGGGFTELAGTDQKYFAGLTNDGSMDSEFNKYNGVFGNINTIYVREDEKILLGGSWLEEIKIIESDGVGVRDDYFDLGDGANGAVHELTMKEDRIIITGEFTSFDGASRNRVARLCALPILEIGGGIRCGSGQVEFNATVDNGVISWYQNQDDATPLGTGTTFLTPTIDETTSFYVTAENDCGITEFVIQAEVRTFPVIEEVIEPTAPGCDGASLELVALPNITHSHVAWYDQQEGGNLLKYSNNDRRYFTEFLTESKTYYVAAHWEEWLGSQLGWRPVPSCVSLERVPVKATVNRTPETPVINVDGNTLSSSADTGNQWFKNGSQINGAIEKTYIAEESGEYSVQVADGHCLSTMSGAATVEILGISEQFLRGVYPNPVENFLFIDFPSTSQMNNMEIIVMDVLGNVIDTKVQFMESGHKIDVSGLTPGSYILQIGDQSETESIRFIKN